MTTPTLTKELEIIKALEKECVKKVIQTNKACEKAEAKLNKARVKAELASTLYEDAKTEAYKAHFESKLAQVNEQDTIELVNKYIDILRGT